MFDEIPMRVAVGAIAVGLCVIVCTVLLIAKPSVTEAESVFAAPVEVVVSDEVLSRIPVKAQVADITYGDGKLGVKIEFQSTQDVSNLNLWVDVLGAKDDVMRHEMVRSINVNKGKSAVRVNVDVTEDELVKMRSINVLSNGRRIEFNSEGVEKKVSLVKGQSLPVE